MLNLIKLSKKRTFRIYIKQLLLLIFAVLFFDAGVYAESSLQTPQTYKITLPQKVSGVKKLEYVIDNKNMGSISGQNDVNLAANSVLNFLVQIESENYSKLRVKDVKIHSQTGQTLSLMRYMYDKDGNLIKVAIPENDLLDVNQTYVTSDYNVFYNDVLSLSKLNKDSFSAKITMDSGDYSISEAINLSYSLGAENEQKIPKYNSTDNSFEISDITVNTPLKLTFNKKEDFSKSEIKVFNNGEELKVSPEGAASISAVRSDVNITLKGIHKNEYSLNFANYEDLTFKYKKHDSNEDFKLFFSGPLSVISGESYDFMCSSKNNDVLVGKEITANNVALKETGGVYSIFNIKEDIKIDVNSKEGCYYKINLPGANSGVSIMDENDNLVTLAKSKFGESFKFKIKGNDGYVRNITDAIIYAVPDDKLEDSDYDIEKNKDEANSYLLTPSYSGIYTISDVKQPISIIVKNLERDSYKVILPENLTGVSYRVTTSDEVKEISKNSFFVRHGAKMFVTLEAEEGKSIENAEIGSSNQDVLVTKNNNEYIVENITDDLSLAINNIEDKKCKITFENEGILCKDEKGYVLSSQDITTDYKGSIKFGIGLKTGYRASSEIELSIKSGSAVLNKLSNENFYELSNVTENIVIAAKGIEKEKVMVNLSSGGNSVVFKSAENNQVLPNVNTVDYGSDISFTVDSNNGGNQQYMVTSSSPNSDLELLDSSNNAFILRNVSSSITLSAAPVFASSYDVANNTSDAGGVRSGVSENSVRLFSSGYINFERVDNSLVNDATFTITVKDDSDTAIASSSVPYNEQSKSIDVSNILIPLLYTPDDASYNKEFTIEFTVESANCPNVSIQQGKCALTYGDDQVVTLDKAQSCSYNSLGYNYFFNLGEPSVPDSSCKPTLSVPVSYTASRSKMWSFGQNIRPLFNSATISFSLDSKYVDSTIKFNDSEGYASFVDDNDNKSFSLDSEYVDSTIKFNDSEGYASFVDNNDNKFTNNEQSVSANNFLIFKLKCDEYKGFNTDDADILKEAIIVGSAPSLTNYSLEVLQSESTKSCVKYKISQLASSTGGNLNIQIGVNNNLIEKIMYVGTFAGSGVEYLKENEDTKFSSKKLSYDETFSFRIQPSAAADNDIESINILVDSNRYNYDFTRSGETVNVFGKLKVTSKSEDGEFIVTLSDISADFRFITNYKRKNVKVDFTTDGLFYYKILTPAEHADPGEYYSDSIHVKYGQTLSFVIIAADGVDISNVVVTANGVNVNIMNGKYTIKSISEFQDIRATGASKFKYNISFTQYDDIFFKDANSRVLSEQTPVEYGAKIDFRVAVSDAYSSYFSNSENNGENNNKQIKVLVECASGNTLDVDTSDSGMSLSFNKNTHTYTLSNVNQTARVYVNGIEPNEYKVILQPINGMDYFNQYGTEKYENSTVTVRHGENFSFKVVAQEGYELSNLKIYDKAGTTGVPVQLLSARDIYTINNITSDHTITAQNVSVTKHKVEFRSTTGVSCVDLSGGTIGKEVTVDYGSEYKFKLSLDTAYSKSNPTVNIKGVSTPLPKNSDGTYTIPNIKEDKIIEILNVTKNSYTATFKAAEGVIYKTAKNKPFTETQQVEYDSTLYFKISLMDAYDDSTPWVLLNGDKTLVENGGVYSLENIRDDVVVTVKNVVKNPEEVEISDIANISTEISSESDVDAVVRATQNYMNLSDEDKEQVTNIDDLKKAQTNAGNINHSSNGVEISGVDWNIKIIVTPLSDNEEQMRNFAEKVERRSLFSLYEIHLVDVMTGLDYEVPFGQKVSVILPAPDLTGCTSAVVAHEKDAGNMEYLDINIVGDRAQFETSSFSMFGIAAKKIQNYVENPSDMKISVASLVDNEEELKSLLGEGLVSQLGSLLDSDKKEGSEGENSGNIYGEYGEDVTSSQLSNGENESNKKLFGNVDLQDTYNWMLSNELLSVILILLVGALLIWLLLFLARRKRKDKSAEK